ncbi:MAG: asparagine synthase (glutamine-hydrolyzing) [Deltaproteobacteria bacterium]|nr:asparagine synthase (glutamine-hydrolyzing) [Deltaproteobacteria bacterium]
MCGIFGKVTKNLSREELEQASNSLVHRGPDDAGIYISPLIGLGHRRLSIIDLAGGHQPVFNEDGSKCIVFNGEIFNYVGLRDQLISKGHVFSTRSDTETILHAYEEWGETCVERLRGMFAFAIWDEKSKELFLARDRLGIKPLFYAEHDGAFYFASEMKAILANRHFPREMDDLALIAYFSYSYIPKALTIYKHIRKLLPGHTLTVQDGRLKFRKYWDLHIAPDRGKNEAYFIHRLGEILEEAVRIRLMSEVPLGAFLSGGIDSSTVVALMSRNLGSAANTFCIGFGGNAGGYLDERLFAREVARRYSTNHREYEVHPEIQGLLETIVSAFDEPFADDSAIPSYYVCRMARENVTVALSGLGGDEVFAGYERYLGFALRKAYTRFPLFMRENLRSTLERLPERADGHYTINHMKRFARSASLPPDLAYLGFATKTGQKTLKALFSGSERFGQRWKACRDLLLSEFNSENVEEPHDSLHRAMYCDIKTYLPEDILSVTDRMSMQHGLEVRVPFLDHPFMEFCATIPVELKMKWFQKKYLLKKAVKHLLPHSVLHHRKQGFVGPMTQWLKNDLKPTVESHLCEDNLRKHGLFNAKMVRRILAEHFSGKEIHDTLIWSLLVFQTWYERYMENRES